MNVNQNPPEDFVNDEIGLVEITQATDPEPPEPDNGLDSSTDEKRAFPWLRFAVCLYFFCEELFIFWFGGIYTFAVTMFCYMPTVAFFLWCDKKQTSVVTLDAVLWKFFLGASCGYWLVFIVQIILFLILASIYVSFYGPVAWTILALACLSFALCVPEEIMKYVLSSYSESLPGFRSPVVLASNSLEPPPSPNAKILLINCIAATLGYSTMQATFLLYKVNSLGGNAAYVLFFATIMMVFFIPLHLLTSYLIGLWRAKKMELNLQVASWRILLFTIAVRSIYYWLSVVPLVFFLSGFWTTFFCELSFSFVVCISLLLFAKYQEKQMPASYLKRVGYLNAFGYGLLATAEEADEGVAELGVVAELGSVE